MGKLAEGYYLNKKEKELRYLYSNANFGSNGLIDFYTDIDGRIVSHIVNLSDYAKIKIICQLKRK